MAFYEFAEKDVLRNVIKAYPHNTFFVTNGSVYYNNRNNISGAHVASVPNIPSGFISLYGLNVDRAFGDHTYDPDTNTGVKARIFPFITKDSSLNSFSSVSTTSFNEFQYGDMITGSYPMSSSIVREAFATNHGINASTGSHILALKNTLNYYTPLSPRYAFSSSFYGNKALQECTLISIPSIFYGSTIKKNSIKLKFYISGTLVATCEDLHRNGELIQTSGTVYAQANGTGSVAGMVLYNEGFVLLTGSWDLTEGSYDFGAGAGQGTWLDFGVGANDGVSSITPSASFDLSFQGTTYISTIMMHADAPLGDLNFSPNPTFVKYTPDTKPAQSGTNAYVQNNELVIKNTVSSSFYDYNAKFKRQTFISKIGIYDENKNLIAIANLAKPIKKTEDRDFTFRLKLDI